MELEEVRNLKHRAIQEIVRPVAVSAIKSRTLAYGARSLERATVAQPQRTLALGVSRHEGAKGYRLAVRLQLHSMLERPEIERLRRMAHGELDIRFVGRIDKRAVPWHQRPQRPLLIGSSVGHYQITAGTLGAFVRPVGQPQGELFVLSNNHVLANENRGKPGDPVLQPGRLDGGTRAHDRIGTLSRFVRLKKTGNLVDCAIAQLDEDIKARLRTLRGIGGELQGLSSRDVDTGMVVRKVGRTTGATSGRVTAFELDDVVVNFDTGNMSFDRQIEIEGAGDRPFSDGGDSGSLIVDEENGAVALLFAGSETGGTNNRGLTYANPIDAVLSALRIELALR